jgi:hypothetical protein
MKALLVRGGASEWSLPGSCKARCRIADAVRHECWRMKTCLFFRADFPMPGARVLALTRFGTAGLSAMSVFDTLKTGHGYRRGLGLVGAGDVSN